MNGQIRSALVAASKKRKGSHSIVLYSLKSSVVARRGAVNFVIWQVRGKWELDWSTIRLVGVIKSPKFDFMAFSNFFPPSAKLESLIEKIQQQKSSILITGTGRTSSPFSSEVSVLGRKEALIKIIKWYHRQVWLFKKFEWEKWLNWRTKTKESVSWGWMKKTS